MKYCPNCGAEVQEGATFCEKCGASMTVQQEAVQQPQQQPVAGGEQKSKMAAGLLGIFLGAFGVHNFYLGFKGKAITQLLLTLVGWLLCGLGPLAAEIWGIVEGVMILTGSINADANGVPLKD